MRRGNYFELTRGDYDGVKIFGQKRFNLEQDLIESDKVIIEEIDTKLNVTLQKDFEALLKDNNKEEQIVSSAHCVHWVAIDTTPSWPAAKLSTELALLAFTDGNCHSYNIFGSNDKNISYIHDLHSLTAGIKISDEISRGNSHFCCQGKVQI